MSAAATVLRPYIGLRYFEERDAHLYFGRDEHVARGHFEGLEVRREAG